MAQATLTARVDAEDKKGFERFCKEVGLTVSGAMNLYVKAVLHERKIPFAIAYPEEDPFYSEENMRVLRKSIAQAKAGKLEYHEMLDDSLANDSKEAV